MITLITINEQSNFLLELDKNSIDLHLKSPNSKVKKFKLQTHSEKNENSKTFGPYTWGNEWFVLC